MVRIPEVPSNIKLGDVAKSPASLNNTSELLPGGAAVIVAILPALIPGSYGLAIAVKELPLKSS